MTTIECDNGEPCIRTSLASSNSSISSVISTTLGRSPVGWFNISLKVRGDTERLSLLFAINSGPPELISIQRTTGWQHQVLRVCSQQDASVDIWATAAASSSPTAARVDVFLRHTTWEPRERLLAPDGLLLSAPREDIVNFRDVYVAPSFPLQFACYPAVPLGASARGDTLRVISVPNTAALEADIARADCGGAWDGNFVDVPITDEHSSHFSPPAPAGVVSFDSPGRYLICYGRAAFTESAFAFAPVEVIDVGINSLFYALVALVGTLVFTLSVSMLLCRDNIQVHNMPCHAL